MTPSTETYHFEESENIPNHPSLPVVVYRKAVSPDRTVPAEVFEARYRENEWGGSWRWGVYAFHHYHSNAHEVLGVVAGEAELTLGGPGGKTLSVRAGDVLILPAGTGHKNDGSTSDFNVIGAYPGGQ
ncbi:MAG: cupin domain-containing protein, partial [Oceanipulchritudo sp.]